MLNQKLVSLTDTLLNNKYNVHRQLPCITALNRHTKEDKVAQIFADFVPTVHFT